MIYLFTYSDYSHLKIPPTINHLEGLFGHLKERVKIHRGLNKNRKKKAVRFLLRNLGGKKEKIGRASCRERVCQYV